MLCNTKQGLVCGLLAVLRDVKRLDVVLPPVLHVLDKDVVDHARAVLDGGQLRLVPGSNVEVLLLQDESII